MIIELSSCRGDYDIKMSNKVIDYDDNKNDLKFETRIGNGKNIYTLNKLKDNHIYMSIKPIQQMHECLNGKELDSNGIQCSPELSYLLYYYSTTERQYKSSEINTTLTYRPGERKQIWIKIPKIKYIDYQKNTREIDDIEFNLFWTKNVSFFRHMESICYLSQVLNSGNNESIVYYKDIKLNEENEFPISVVPDEKYYITVLAKNLKTNELIMYKPIRGRREINSYVGFIISMLVIALLLFVAFVLYKYCFSKDKNQEFSRINEKETEMSDRNKGIKYTTINAESF